MLLNIKDMAKKTGKTVWLNIAFYLAIAGLVSTFAGTILYSFVIFPYYEHKNRAEVTETRMTSAYKDILLMAENAGEFPPVKPTQFKIRTNFNGTGYDGWNTALSYRHRKTHVELRSAGADKKMHTEDDVVITSKRQPASFGPLKKGDDKKQSTKTSW